MKNLEEYIALINTAGTADEAFSRFAKIMAKHGYDKVTYSLLTDHPSLSLQRMHGLATSYPEDWMKHYRANNYIDIDPVVSGILKSRVPFFWNDLRKNPDHTPEALSILDKGHDAGVKDGIGIPLFGSTGEIVGVGLARSEVEKGQDYQFLASAYLLSTYFHEKYRSFLQAAVTAQVSQKQCDIISWAAEGKTDEEIGVIMNLSPHTIRWHWKRIFVNLGARGRTYAIAKAISLGLVLPARIQLPKMVVAALSYMPLNEVWGLL